MTRVWLRIAIGLVVGCLLPIGLIRAQPYDDGGLRDFLSRSDCAAPCFLTIRPGVTPFYEAELLLQAHAWVSQIERNRHTLIGEPATIRWQWSGNQPPYLDNMSWNSLHSDDGTFVDEVLARVGQPLGDVWLSLGPPEDYELIPVSGQKFPDVVLALVIRYSDFAILGVIDCPYHARLWQARVAARFQLDPSLPEPSLADHHPLAGRVTTLAQAWCRT